MQLSVRRFTTLKLASLGIQEREVALLHLLLPRLLLTRASVVVLSLIFLQREVVPMQTRLALVHKYLLVVLQIPVHQDLHQVVHTDLCSLATLAHKLVPLL